MQKFNKLIAFSIYLILNSNKIMDKYFSVHLFIVKS